MTVVLDDRIEMAESGNRSLDEMFALLEQWPVPEGYKVEIVEGTIHMTPQRATHWQAIRRVLYQLDDHFGREAEILSDVRIDFPGYLNGFCPDLVKIADGAQPDNDGRYAPRDIELIVEVLSRGTARNDYGPKKATYDLVHDRERALDALRLRLLRCRRSTMLRIASLLRLGFEAA